MIIPIRCFSCGRLIADKWEDYKSQVDAGKNAKEVLDDLGVESYCCRTIFLTHVDLIEKIARYKTRIVPKVHSETKEAAEEPQEE
jgi:DNA-directed RNA polymerase subunit N